MENHLECFDLYLLVFKFYFEWLTINVNHAVKCHTDFTIFEPGMFFQSLIENKYYLPIYHLKWNVQILNTEKSIEVTLTTCNRKKPKTIAKSLSCFNFCNHLSTF